MSEAQDKLKAGVQTAKDSAGGIADKLSSKAGEIGKAVQDKVGQVGQAVSDGYDNLSGKARDSISSGKEAAMDWEESLEDFIEERPIAAVLIAAVVGMVLAMLLGRSRK